MVPAVQRLLIIKDAVRSSYQQAGHFCRRLSLKGLIYAMLGLECVQTNRGAKFDMTWPKDMPFDPERKRFYLVSEDMKRNPSDYDVLNEEEIYPLTNPDPDGDRFLVICGQHKFVVPGNSYESYYGLPHFLNKPKVFVARKNRPLDIYGFHTRRIISTRAKNLLSEIDPDAFEFVECETVTRRGLSVDPYWIMDIARIVHNFDEERSVFETAKGIDGATGEAYDGPHFVRMFDIRMSPDLSPSYHAFLFSRHLQRMVFDEVLVDAWRERRFSGAEFDALQPPAPKERTEAVGWHNSFYWRGGRYRTNGLASS